MFVLSYVEQDLNSPGKSILKRRVVYIRYNSMSITGYLDLLRWEDLSTASGTIPLAGNPGVQESGERKLSTSACAFVAHF